VTPGSANGVPEMTVFLSTLVEIGFLDGKKKAHGEFRSEAHAGAGFASGDSKREASHAGGLGPDLIKRI
jgi:hypothetical protein